jgi:alpha-L-fucosidase
MHKTIICLPIAATCWTSAFAATNEPPRAPAIETLASTTAEHDARIAWWREARFGMFVHWGVSSVLGGSWNGRAYQGYAEHIQRMAKIPVPVYHEQVAGAFNPTNFDADAWIKLAKDTGMGYFIITSKHHDGFAMFDSKASPWNVVDATPWHHDPMKDLAASCKKHGIKFGFYYSHAFDWGEENGAGNDWDWANPGGDKLLHGSDWWLTYPEFLPKVRKYVDEKAIPQILELITNYHPDILWFDTPHKIPPEENLRIFAAVRKADPNIVINGRIFSGANPDWFRLTDYINTGDKPGEFAPQDGDWEGIPTTNESFGHNANDHSHKSPGHFIRLLAKAAARGGNILMNMGPRGDGTIDPVDVKIFQGIGAWWRTNGESIRGTTRTPLPRQTWTGESTRKGDTLYLHVFEWPKHGELLVSGLKTDVKRVRVLAAPTAKIAVKRLNESDLLLTGLPVAAPDAADSVIALECVSEPAGNPAQLITPSVAKNVLQGLDSKLSGPATYRAGRGVGDAWVVNWTNTNAAVTWKVRVNEPTTFKASLVYDASAGTAQNRLVEGDAGKELAKANSGAGGTYVVTIAGQTFERVVKLGRPVNEPLGQVTLAPGEHEVRVAAKEITGAELFRLRRLVLEAVTK